MIPMFLYLFVLLVAAFLIEGAAKALTHHKDVNKCVEYDNSHGGC